MTRRIGMVAMLLVLVAGCGVFGQNVTSMRFERTAPGVFTLNSGKNVKADEIDAEEAGGLKIHIKGFSSMADTAAIEAQAKREVGMVNAISDATMKALQAGAGLAAKGVGVP